MPINQNYQKLDKFDNLIGRGSPQPDKYKRSTKSHYCLFSCSKKWHGILPIHESLIQHVFYWAHYLVLWQNGNPEIETQNIIPCSVLKVAKSQGTFSFLPHLWKNEIDYWPYLNFSFCIMNVGEKWYCSFL